MTLQGVDKFNILFANVGRRVAIIQSFREAMAKLNISGKIFGVDANHLSPAYYVTDQSFPICRIEDADYVPSLLEICNRERIKLLISLLDTDLLKLAESREVFRDHGTFVLISSPEVVRIARDKSLTQQFFLRNGIRAPSILTFEEAIEQNRFPLFIKPVDGSASHFTFRIDDQEALGFFFNYVPRPIIQEFVPGQEYTLDLFIDMDGEVRAVVPRKRLEVRAGEVSKSQIVLDPRILQAARRVGEALAAIGGLGPINVQSVWPTEEGAEGKFIEINPRFGGGSHLSLKAGYPFPQWIMEMVLGQELSPLPNDLGDGFTMMRYDEAVFIRPNR
jgi:carbamoyl-phosphate synthase large subunit